MAEGLAFALAADEVLTEALHEGRREDVVGALVLSFAGFQIRQQGQMLG
ncbi:MAG: hypothetical protein P8020_22005 [Acidobacteriota bacterium]